MFHRITVENWQSFLAIVSFAIFFTSFLFTLLRLHRMKGKQTDHLSNLPLEEDTHE
jgi:hypothetical protein